MIFPSVEMFGNNFVLIVLVLGVLGLILLINVLSCFNNPHLEPWLSSSYRQRSKEKYMHFVQILRSPMVL